MFPLNLNRTNDAVFKFTFAKPEHEDITLSLVNSVLEARNTGLVRSLVLIDRELDPEYEDEKESRLDLLGQSPDGDKVNVEIQVDRMEDMGRRSLMYWSRLYDSLKRGEEYSELKRTVMINILDYTLFDRDEFPGWHSCFGLYDPKTGLQLTTDLEIHFLELPKLVKKPVDDMTLLEKWMAYFWKKTPQETLEEIAMTEPMIKKALDSEVIFTSDQIMRRHYEKVEKARRDRLAQLRFAERSGHAAGVREGHAAGMRDTIKRFISAGTSIELIETATGWSRDAIERLKRDISG